MRSVASFLISIALAALLSPLIQAVEVPTIVVRDDWNDNDWISTIPGDEWTRTCGSHSSITIKKEGPSGNSSDRAVRWTPRKKNPITPSMSLTGLAASGAESASWILRWDERWNPTDMRQSSSQIVSRSKIKIGATAPLLGGGTAAGEWTLDRLSPDAGNQLVIQATFGGTAVDTFIIPYPAGFDPIQGQYLRYLWTRDLYSNQMTLTADVLDFNGIPTGTSYVLADIDSTLYGAVTASGTLTGDSVTLTSLEFGAAITEDGFDANADNVVLLSTESIRPKNLDDFKNINDYASLGYASMEEMIAGESYIYFPPNTGPVSQTTYTLQNPVTINRNTPLFLFGVGVLNKTTLRASDETEPLFVVESAPHIGVSGIEFWPGTDNVTDARAFKFVNPTGDPVRFEAQDSAFYRYTVEIAGPGVFIIQSCLFNGRFTGNTDALVVNDPDAEVYLVGGFAGHYKRSYVALEQGHLEVHGSALGFVGIDDTDPLRADFRIEAASPKSAHFIDGVRSEGTKSQHASPFLRVPATAEAVNVVLKNNISTYKLAQSPEISDPGPIVDYNATGTLWMVGHVGRHTSAESLVAGNAPGATIVAIGNQFEGGVGTPPEMLPVTGATEIFAANIYDHEHSAEPDDPTDPEHRFVNPTATLPPTMPPVPVNAHNGAIPKLDRPVINAPVPAGLLVDVTTYGAVPDDGLDDATAIQAAMDAEGPKLYFPPGTFDIGTTLEFHTAGKPFFAAGGLFAGAGPDLTRLLAMPGVGTVFRTDGMAYTIWQGITFEVPEKKAASGSVFELENETGVGDSTTENPFHDCKFIGGRFGFSLGLNTPTMSDITLVVDSEFHDSVVGFANGSFNALNNYVHGAAFVNNDYAIGSAPIGDGLLSGGTWGVLSATMTGTAIDDLNTRNNVQKLYHNRIVSDGNSLSQSLGYTTHPGSLFFDQCTFVPSNPLTPDYLSYTQGGGVTFLDSYVGDGHQRYTIGGSQKFLLSLDTEWGSCPVPMTTPCDIETDANSAVYSLP